MTEKQEPGRATRAEDKEERDDEQDRGDAEREGIAEDNRLERAIEHNNAG